MTVDPEIRERAAKAAQRVHVEFLDRAEESSLEWLRKQSGRYWLRVVDAVAEVLATAGGEPAAPVQVDAEANGFSDGLDAAYTGLVDLVIGAIGGQDWLSGPTDEAQAARKVVNVLREIVNYRWAGNELPRTGQRPPAAPVQVDAEQIARLFHETYERLAPRYSYKTREASAVPWEQVPENNRRLMVAVAGRVARELGVSGTAGGDPNV